MRPIASRIPRGLIPFVSTGTFGLLSIALAIDSLTACAGAPPSPESALVGTWSAPKTMPDNGYTKLTLKSDKTGTGVFKHADEKHSFLPPTKYNAGTSVWKTVVSEKTENFDWHADKTHLWVIVKNSPTANEVNYSIDGDTLTFGVLDGGVQHVMHRVGG